MLKSKSIIFSALFVYLFLAPFFFHPDLKVIYYLGSFLQESVLNIYSFIGEHKEKAMLGPFVYPPLTYFIVGILSVPIKLFAGSNFTSWLAMGNDMVDIKELPRFVFLMKFPFILVHILTGIFLARLVEGESLKKKILSLWYFNPISLYAVAMIGQIDVVVSLLTVLTLVWLSKRPNLSALLLGLGAAIKGYPLLLIPYAALAQNTLRRRVVFCLFALVPYLLIILPFLKTREFWTDTLASGLSQRIFQTSLSLGYGEQILIVPTVLVLLWFFLFYSKGVSLANCFMSVPLAILSFSHFHPQWVLWALPFIVLSVVKYRSWMPFALLTIGYFGTVFLIDDKFLTWGLFSPLNPGVFSIPTISGFLGLQSSQTFQSLFHTLFAASAFWLIFISLKNADK